MNRLPLSGLTLDAVQAEAIRANLRRGALPILDPNTPPVFKLAALGRAFGEVSHVLTGYTSSDSTGERVGLGRDHLVIKLIRVASVALSWVESLEGGHDGALLDDGARGDPVHDRLGGSSQPS